MLKNISFKFAAYQKTVITHIEEATKEETISKTREQKIQSFIEKSFGIIFGFIYLVAIFYIVDFVDKKDRYLYILGMMEIPIFVYLGIKALSEKNVKPKEVISGELVFLEDKIQIKNQQSFSYSQISQIELIFNGVSEGIMPSTSSLLIHINEDIHTYSIVIDSDFKRKKMINILTYLYEQKVPIKEWNKSHEEIYLLQKIAVPEIPKAIEIDVKIQNLIDEIGENEA